MLKYHLASSSLVPERKGETFEAFIKALSTGLDINHPAWDEIKTALGDEFPYEQLERGLGYNIEWNVLRACDYGAPTIRKRFFLVAGRRIVRIFDGRHPHTV